jgi:hypothetical protein
MLESFVVIQQPPNNISYTIPKQIPGHPTIEDLVRNILYISNSLKSVYYLNKEAMEIYSSYIDKVKYNSIAGSISKDVSYIETLLKSISMLIKISIYSNDSYIGPIHVNSAINIIDKLLISKPTAFNSTNIVDRHIGMAKRLIIRRCNVSRTVLQRSLSSKGTKVEEFNRIIEYLLNTSFIKVFDNEMNELSSDTKSGTNIYKYNE